MTRELRNMSFKQAQRVLLNIENFVIWGRVIRVCCDDSWWYIHVTWGSDFHYSKRYVRAFRNSLNQVIEIMKYLKEMYNIITLPQTSHQSSNCSMDSNKNPQAQEGSSFFALIQHIWLVWSDWSNSLRSVATEAAWVVWGSRYSNQSPLVSECWQPIK